MKKLLAVAVALLGTAVLAQTNAEIVAKALAVRNAGVCSALDLDPTCNDEDARAAWCVKNNKPEGAMCAASDTRSLAERVATPAEMHREKQAEQDRISVERLKRQRRSTLAEIEIAILDPDIRAAVCAATKRIPAEKCR